MWAGNRVMRNLLKLVPFFSLLVVGTLAQQPITDETLFFGGSNSTTNNSAYFSWFNDKGSFYGNAVFVPLPTTVESGAAIHWRIEGDKIYLAVASRAQGWLGFGLAEAGGMKGADIVYYTASTNQLVDAYVLDDYEYGPQPDECQNWELLEAWSSGGFIIFEAVRDLDTGDTQDRPIINDGNPGNVPAHRIIAAWGDSPEISYHGPTNRVRSAVRFYGQPDDTAIFYQTMKNQSEGSFEIRATNYTIKQLDTEYKHFCFSREDLIALGVPDKPIQVIGWEPIVSNGSTSFVHHFLVYGSQNPNTGLPYSGSQCDNATIYQVGYGTCVCQLCRNWRYHNMSLISLKCGHQVKAHLPCRLTSVPHTWMLLGISRCLSRSITTTLTLCPISWTTPAFGCITQVSFELTTCLCISSGIL
jgi:hypothetical protein